MRLETRLLCAVITSANQKEAHPITLSKQQRKAAIALSQGLETNAPDADCTELLRDLFLSLYAPQDPSPHTVNIFSSPVVAYLALICKTPQGTYHTLKRIASCMATMQTCIRLRCFGHLMKELDKAVAEDEIIANDDWVEYEISSSFTYYLH